MRATFCPRIAQYFRGESPVTVATHKGKTPEPEVCIFISPNRSFPAISQAPWRNARWDAMDNKLLTI